MKLYGARTNILKIKKKIMPKYPKYFDLEEFLTSSTARQKSIENMPSWEIVEHLLELAFFLDDLREEWGSGIHVSSGLRVEVLNKAVGGVDTSVHKIGYAADIQPVNGKFDDFVEFIKNWAIDKKYDQIIIESKGKTKWVHIGLYNQQHMQRKKLFNMTVK